jgi:phosphatidylserine synthase
MWTSGLVGFLAAWLTATLVLVSEYMTGLLVLSRWRRNAAGPNRRLLGLCSVPAAAVGGGLVLLLDAGARRMHWIGYAAAGLLGVCAVYRLISFLRPDREPKWEVQRSAGMYATIIGGQLLSIVMACVAVLALTREPFTAISALVLALLTAWLLTATSSVSQGQWGDIKETVTLVLALLGSSLLVAGTISRRTPLVDESLDPLTTLIIIASMLLIDIEFRVRRRSQPSRASAPQVFEWVSLAIASGMLGNAAWDAMKVGGWSLFHRFQPGKRSKLTRNQVLAIARAAVVIRARQLDVAVPDLDAREWTLYRDEHGMWLVAVSEGGRHFWVRIPAGKPTLADVDVDVHVTRPGVTEAPPPGARFRAFVIGLGENDGGRAGKLRGRRR